MKTKSHQFTNIFFPVLLCCIFPMVFCSVPAANARAAEDPYAIISKKNLFHPERKEWIMEKTDGKAGDAKKAVSKIDLKQIKLIGTVISGNEKKAIIKNSLKRSTGKDVDTYMTGDYIEGYLLKEIEAKRVLLSNAESNDSVELFLHEGATQRSSEKTDVTMPSMPVEEKKNIRQKSVTTSDLTERMKQSKNILSQRDSPHVRQQVERDFKKMQEHFSDMSEQEQQEAILLKKEIDRIKNEKR
jgi:hypothetical protein